MALECVRSGVNRRDVLLIEFAKVTGCEIRHDWSRLKSPVIVGFLNGAAEAIKECRERRWPYVFIDHGYLHRNAPIYDMFRICVNHYHLTDFRNSNRGYSDIRIAPWKSGDDVIVIPPTGIVADVYRARGWLSDTLWTLERNTDRRIVVKEKGHGNLQEMLKTAHALVSYGSVAEVEAALAGVPVFTTCGPSLPIAETDFSKIETPRTPDRDQWLSALAGAEYHLDEMNLAWERINEYYHLR